ncbi:hypothetical protein ACIOZM_26980 [Pseudomonas sp. NPDC087346]|uniref:hypothetical protein n=1 Tax=Pseudomonas sp. NPDC087346 TaxID=3364438 RepID=UPI0037FCCBD4
MALIECYECKRSISSQATACIHCGAPMAERPTEQQSADAQPQAAPVASTISFGSLPRNKAVPEAYVAPAEPEPKAVPVAVGRRRRTQAAAPVQPQVNADGSRPVEGWLKIMAFLMPMIFVWFLLRSGHSLKQRVIGFGWLGLLILCVAITPTPPPV